MKTPNKLLILLSSVALLAGCASSGEDGQQCPDCPECGQCPTCQKCEQCEECPTPHEHTYDVEHWKSNDTHHWHESTCEHKGLASDLGEHTYNSEGVCTACGHIKDVEMFTFTFKSDYCDLNNDEIYQEGQEVELTLTLKDAFKSTFSVPSEIEVYSNGLLLTKGEGYTYVVDDNVGTLSLKVNGNIVVQAYRTKDESAFQVNEQEFETAMNISSLDYFQYEIYYARYSDYSLIMYDALIESSPLVIYRAGATLNAFSHSSNLNYQYQYIENEDSNYTEYTYSDSDVGWEKSESTEEQFNRYKTVNLRALPFISSDFTLSYEAIKDHYNHVNKAYDLEFSAGSYNVKFEISFYNGKIIDISYSDNSDYGFIANVSLSYDEKDVVIPEDVKPHVHTFSTEWSKDETYHWHAATCEHTDVVDSYGKHTLDENGACTVCGYTPEKLYPVITKTEVNHSFGATNVSTNTWADDYLSVTTVYDGVPIEPNYMYFDEFGNITEEGKIFEEVYEPKVKKEYENNLIVSELIYSENEVCERKSYTYEEGTNNLLEFKHFDVDGKTETIYREETTEYGADYMKTVVKIYKEGVVDDYYEYLWTYTTENGNRKEIYSRKNGVEGELKEYGYLLYNDKDQLIEVKDTNYGSEGAYAKYTYLSYRDDGELASVTVEDEQGFKQKNIFNYDENGFIKGFEFYNFNDGTQQYDILYGGCDYEVDTRGTITKRQFFNMEESERIVYLTIEYEIAYLPVNFDVEYDDYVAETKGTYNLSEINSIKTIG